MLSPSASALAPTGAGVDVSLAGENVNELDAYAARCRETRIAEKHGYGVAEHLLQSMPDRVLGRKLEASAVAAPGPFRQETPHRIDDARIA